MSTHPISLEFTVQSPIPPPGLNAVNFQVSQIVTVKKDSPYGGTYSHHVQSGSHHFSIFPSQHTVFNKYGITTFRPKSGNKLKALPELPHSVRSGKPQGVGSECQVMFRIEDM